MKLDYRNGTTLSYLKFIELYEENELELKNRVLTKEQEQVQKEIKDIEAKINSAECTGCAKSRYNSQLEELYKKLNAESVEVAQYNNDKKTLLSYLNINDKEALKQIEAIDAKLSAPVEVKKAVIKKTPKKKVENATKSK